MGLVRASLVEAGNKNTSGKGQPSQRYFEIIIRYKTSSDDAHTKFKFLLSTFFEKQLSGYRGVVTVTETDFGPRTVLTTAATAYVWVEPALTAASTQLVVWTIAGT
jgi:hypothetical protein